MNKFSTACLAGLLACSSAAMADYDTGIFFGGNVGYANQSNESGLIGAQFSAPGAVGSVTVDDSDIGWKVYMGYAFSQYFGVEAGYVDLGESQSLLNSRAPTRFIQDATLNLTGWTATAVARWPVIDRLEFIAKFGGIFWDQEFGSVVTAAGITTTSIQDDDGTDMTGGLGLKYQVSEHIGVRAEWDRYISIGDFDSDVDLFSMGLEFTY